MSTFFDQTLPNGLRLIVEPMPGVRSAAVSWLVPGGTAYDPDSMLGRSAVLEEMLARGAGELDSRAEADAFDRLGASRSISAGARFMRLGASLLGERITPTLVLLSQTVLRPRLAEDALAPAKDLALQAIEALPDDPQERTVLAARSRHFAPPFDRSGLGTPEGIAAITRDALAQSWTATARPRGSILAVAGAVDAGVVRSEIDRMLGSWSGACAPVAPAGDAPRGYDHIDDDSAQVQIVLVHDAPPEPDPRSMLERVVVAVLSGGMSGRLFTEVREKRGLCYAVSAAYRAEQDYGAVTAYVGTTPERAQESLDVLHAELERIHSTGIEPDEFRRAMVRMKSGVVFSGESSAARAAALASDAHKLGHPRTLEQITAQIDAVTLDAVNAHLKTRSLGRLTIQTLGPAALRAPAGT